MSDNTQEQNAQEQKPLATKNEDGTYTFTLNSYDQVKISIPTPTVSEDELNRMIETLLFQRAELKDLDEKRKAKPGEIVVAKMKTTEGDKTVDELTGDEFLLDVGLGLMPEEFEKAVADLSVGDTTTVTYTIPYGRKLTSEIEMLGLKERIIPALSDAWVQEHFGNLFSTIPEFASGVHAQLVQQKKDAVLATRQNMVADELVKRLNEEIPQELIDKGYEAFMSNLEAMLMLEGRTREQFIKDQGLTEEELSKSEHEEALLGVKRGVALDAMGEHLGVTIESDDEIPDLLGIDPEIGSQLISALKKDGTYDEARESALRNKVLRKVVADVEVSFI